MNFLFKILKIKFGTLKMCIPLIFKCFGLMGLLLISQRSSAQKERNNWYFGKGAGIDFTSGAPVAVTDGSLNTSEGCAAISNSNGQLLFYTDGVTVYNKNHTAMLNGTKLNGNSSSTQSAVVVLKPGSSSLYYVFTVDDVAGADGLQYSVVDMTLNGGLGDVNGTKNVSMLSPTCEKIAVIGHQNKRDFWIITHEFGSDKFHAFLLSSSGVASTAVISQVGAYVGGQKSFSPGYLKPSSNGKYLASVNYQMDDITLCKFNALTGSLTLIVSLTTNGASKVYGAEFSPNNNLLYISEAGGYYGIFQYDLRSGDPTTIQNSQTAIGKSTGGIGALQLGPDNKIYVAQPNDYLAVINKPNTIGINCEFDAQAVYLKGKQSTFGLPTFIGSRILAFTYENICIGSTTIFDLSVSDMDSVLWNFGDPNSGNDNISRETEPKHQFTKPGFFNVRAYIYFNGLTDTLLQEIEIIDVGAINLGADTFLCGKDSIMLSALPNAGPYLWNDGSTQSSLMVKQAGKYWVEVQLDTNICPNSDTINIQSFIQPTLSLGSDTFLCEGDSFILAATGTYDNLNWSTSATSDTLVLKGATKVWADAFIESCMASDTFQMEMDVPPSLAFKDSAVLCWKDENYLDAKFNNSSYLWSDNSTNERLKISEPGMYWVTITNRCGSVSDTTNITLKDCICLIHIPNAFTPSSDNLNETFMPVHTGCEFKEYSFTIYNRWGQKVFETFNPLLSWNGSVDGKQVQNGIYTYVFYGVTKRAEKRKGFGTFTLMR